MAEIFRNQTQEEKKDFQSLMDENDQQALVLSFRKKADEKEAEYHNKKKKPFCRRCALIDYQKMIKDQLNELEHHIGYGELTRIELPDLNLDDYGNPEQFEFKGEKKAMEPIGRVEGGGITRQKQIGIDRTWKCKRRGCNISIYIDHSELSDFPLEKKEEKVGTKK